MKILSLNKSVTFLRPFLDHRWNALSNLECVNSRLLVNGIQEKACLSPKWVLHCAQFFNKPLIIAFPATIKLIDGRAQTKDPKFAGP